MSELDIKRCKKAAEKGLAELRNANARRTVKRPEVRIVKHDPMKSLRAYVADSLCGLNAPPLNDYETGLREAFKEFANTLHPAGYHRDRSKNELMAGLRMPSKKGTMAILKNIKTVRSSLYGSLMGFANDPGDSRFQYGYEDALWLLLGFVDPSIRVTALRYLYSALGEAPKWRATKHGIKSRAPLLKSLQRAWLRSEITT
jgi:hypothetical protein